eukprot:NODE_19197_length_855_cov_2.267857.p4 GENE.NODE_19197_length_855_cov_2.267857~~NODE_19197_length_855_cov_2.267857.p4  ORF type:complete len:83 (-),score=15.92 NODE_19197_length_855_cov_2.267857:321-569(-)
MTAVTGGEDGHVKVWELETGKCTLDIACAHIQTVALDVDWENNWILTGSWDHVASLYDLNTGLHLKRFLRPKRTLINMVFQV